MEVFDMNNKITEGMEVLIFRYIPEWGYNQDNENYIIGTVLKKEKQDDVSCHDNSWQKQVYTVLGEDGEVYTGNYGMGLVGNSFFRTREDQIKFLRRNIAINNANIFILQHRNSEYNKQIDLLTQKEEVKCSSRTLKKQKCIGFKTYVFLNVKCCKIT